MQMELKELGTSSLKIDKLISKIEFGYIKIPPFQRKFVWQKISDYRLAR